MNRFASALVLAALLSAGRSFAEQGAAPPPVAEPVAPTEYVVEAGQVVAVAGTARTVLELPGPVVAVHHEGAHLYVARGNAGVAAYDVSEPLAPKLEREIAVQGSATGFAVIDGQLWVLVTQKSALPLDQAAAPVASPSAEPAEAAPAPSEQAAQEPVAPIAVRPDAPGRVELSRGADGGVRVGDRFAIYRAESQSELGAGYVGEQLVALAEVSAVKRDSALAELSRNTAVTDGDVARTARDDQRESNAYPVRMPHVGEFGGVLRPIVNAGSPLAVGVLAEAHASYWGKAYFCDLILQPVGLGWSSDGNVVSTAGLLQAGYDNRAFAVGLGGGISWVNGNADNMLESSSFGSAADASSAQSSTQVVQRQTTHSAFTLSQQARLGARDGLNLSLRNILILHDNKSANQSGFIYGGTMGKLSVPLDRRSDLFLEGGGGVMGYWLVGAGVGTWIVGNGAPGSWKLSISAGAAGIWGSREVTETTTTSAGQTYTSTYDDRIDIGGPMVSVGFARRFDFR